MKIRFESMPNTCLGIDGNTLSIEKKTTDEQLSTFILNKNELMKQNSSAGLSIKMIPRDAQAIVLSSPIYIINLSEGDHIIFQCIDHDLRIGKLGDDGVVYLTPIDEIEEDDTVLTYHDDDISYTDIISIEEIDSGLFDEREPTNIKTDLCNYVMSINKGRNEGVVINSLILF